MRDQTTDSHNQGNKKSGREYVVVAYFFVAIFVSLIGYLVYFNTVLKDDILSSSYNRRQNQAAEFVVRGDIESLDGKTLAYTEVDSEGNETRIYPYDNLFAHAVGYVNNGKGGLESIANYQLLTSHAFILERIQNEFLEEKNDGDTVVATLDYSLQKTAYDALGKYKGAVVVIEPSTGRILAMVSKPDYNPNTLAAKWESIVNDENSSVLVNRATQGQYAPGSTFKIVTALAYLRSNGNLETYHHDCQGELTMSGHTIHCYGGTVHGSEDFRQAFASSCNTAFAQIGLDIGASALKKTSEELLFNSKLPIDLTYNQSKFTLSQSAGDATIMQTSFGQGDTLVSPMHMALITCAVANGGTLMDTYMIDHVKNNNGDVVSTTKPKAYKTIMSSEEAQTISELMQQVVNSGTASALSGNEYSVAGKTGSAEFYKEDGSMGTHSWFVGFSNVENPDIVVCVLAEGAGTGSSVAVPIAEEIFDEYYD